MYIMQKEQEPPVVVKILTGSWEKGHILINASVSGEVKLWKVDRELNAEFAYFDVETREGSLTALRRRLKPASGKLTVEYISKH